MDLFPTLEEFQRTHGAEDKRRFTALFPHPFLLVDLSFPRSGMSDFATFPGSPEAEKSTEFQASTAGSSSLFVMPVAKSSRNTFHAMVTVGRASNNDLVIPHGSVSKFHAFFRPDPCAERYTIVDAGSSFGTMVNGKEADKGKGSVVESGDTVQFAMLVRATFFSAPDFHDYMHLVKRVEKSRSR
jgi:hypothetical protein